MTLATVFWKCILVIPECASVTSVTCVLSPHPMWSTGWNVALKCFSVTFLISQIGSPGSATLSFIIVPWNCFGMYLQSLGTAVRFSHQSFDSSAWPEKVATRVHAHSMLPFPSFEPNLAKDQLFSLNGSFWRFRRLANRFSSKGSFCHKYGKPGCAFRFRN